MQIKTELCPDGKERCFWCTATSDYSAYHDEEWGFPVTDDQALFEKVCLEGFQSGLSWRTILTKRENFRRAFASFDFNKVACFDHNDVQRLLHDEGIVRHRGKIEATINNAKQAQKIVEEFGSLSAFFWRYEPSSHPDKPEMRSTSSESIELAKELKKRGWKFVGPTTAYAFMQAMGLVNDHASSCWVRPQVVQARKQLGPVVQ